MEQPPKEPPLEEQVGLIRADVVALAKKLRISPKEALTLLMHRELVIVNRQLIGIHEMLDLIYSGKKGRPRR